MEPFDLAQAFIEQGRQSQSSEALALVFQEVLGRLGFRHFACCSHVDPLRPPRAAVMLHNYPMPWVRAYSERKLVDIDPVFRHAERTLLPFSWDAPELRARLTASQREMFAEAASQGLAHGYTIPIHAPWLPGAFHASCSVVPDSPSIGTRSYFAVELMTTYLYDAATRKRGVDFNDQPQNPLSRRERQCLELVAQGKSNWTIGEILGISEHTVHRHIESAKQRLGVATRIQAVIGAAQGHQISIGDVVRAHGR